ncbi:MAG: DUF2905 domain-containing protein [Actinomycetia bacterium]|nr:DUF2905 domain-containing protein [Actinomycetes bacterium]
MTIEAIGKLLVGLAVLLLIVGGLLIFLGKLGLVKLPGDILYRRGNSTYFFPIVTSIVVSLALTVLINIMIWFWRR